jgi:hypothetical protein
MQLWKSPHRMLQSHQDSGRRLNVDNKKMQGEGILSYNNQATSWAYETEVINEMVA